MDLTVVTVAFNSDDIIAQTVSHLEAATAHLDTEILVVDNASADETAARAAQELRRGRVLHLSENIGFGPGVNHGARHARGRRLLIMNDDVLVDRACIDRLLETLESDPAIGVVGPRLVYPDGSPAPTYRFQLPGWGGEAARVIQRLHKKRRPLSTNEPSTVGLVLAACAMTETRVFRQMGGFNEIFFLYGEDIDFCRRLASVGRHAVVEPRAVAIHNQAVSAPRRPTGTEFSDRILRARDTYYRIWITRPSRILLNLYRALGPTDQPYRFKFHSRRAIWDGPSLRSLRTPEPLELVEEE